MSKHEGPTIENIPAHSRQVCRGCVYLDRFGHYMGHTRVTHNYFCIHPDHKNEQGFMGHKGKEIAFDSEQMPTTPDWCPIKNQTKKDANNVPTL